MAFNKDPLVAGNDRDIIDYSNDLENRVGDAFDSIDYDTDYPLTLRNGWTGTVSLTRETKRLISIRGSITSPSNVTNLQEITKIPASVLYPERLHPILGYYINQARVVTFGSITHNGSLRIERNSDGELEILPNTNYQINSVFRSSI